MAPSAWILRRSIWRRSTKIRFQSQVQGLRWPGHPLHWSRNLQPLITTCIRLAMRGNGRAVTLTQSLICALLLASDMHVVWGQTRDIVWRGQLRGGGIERSAPLRESVHHLASNTIKSHELTHHIQEWTASLLDVIQSSLDTLRQAIRSTGSNAEGPSQSDSSADVLKPMLIFVCVVCLLMTTWTLTRRLRSVTPLPASLSHAPGLPIRQPKDANRASGSVRYLTTEMQPALMRRLHRRTGSTIA